MKILSQPLVTIGVTCFNGAATIGRALDSAFAQSWPASEIIIVDDASTDASPALLAARAADGRIQLIAKTVNEGFPAALNTILAAAKGEFIAFFDDDDVSAPDRLAAQIERLTMYESRHSGAQVLCYTNRLVIGAGESVPSHEIKAIGRSPVEPHGAPVADFLLWSRGDPRYCWGMFGSCTLLARTAHLRALGGFDPEFRRSAELDLAIRHASAGGHFIAVDAPLVTQKKFSKPQKAGGAALVYALKLRQKHAAYLRGRGVYSGARLTARARFSGLRGPAWVRRGRSLAFHALAALVAPAILRERCRQLIGGTR